MRSRLLASYLLFACALFVILEVPLGLLETDIQTRASFSFLDRQATALAGVATQDLGRGNLADLRATATSFAARATGLDVAVYDHGGALLLTTGPHLIRAVAGHARHQLQASGDTGVTGRYQGQRGAGAVLYEAKPFDLRPAEPGGAETQGVLVVATTTSRLDGRIAGVDLDLLAVGVAVLAAAVVIALFMSRSLSRPVVDITEAVERIAGGDLAARAPADRGPAELRTLATRVNAMAARIDHLLGAQRAFVADASHQLRTPLTAMRLRLENLSARIGPAAQADVDACADEVARLSRLVDGLLALARAEAGAPEPEVVDAGAVAHERRDAWAPLADERGVLLGLELAGHSATVLAVPGHLEQVLDNLLDNAVEATPPGHHVQLVIANGGSTVELHVVDEGPGMSTEERRRAFDRFWRGTDSDAGSGLGLAIVRQLVEACGGTVELRGADGGGTDATVTLRRA